MKKRPERSLSVFEKSLMFLIRKGLRCAANRTWGGGVSIVVRLSVGTRCVCVGEGLALWCV